MRARRGFASDNNSGIHPDVLAAVERANDGHAAAYGDDEHTARATRVFEEHFGEGIRVFFVLTGTGANVLAFDAITKPYQAVVCPVTSHAWEDECGAPERHAGCKLLPCPAPDGKIGPDDVEAHLTHIGFEHRSQPRVVSISEATELGTVYTPEEVRALADHAHAHDLLLHVDGARLANAAASLDVGLRELTRDAGVDVLCFGGTKNGMLAGEAVVFFDPSLAEGFEYVRKQGMQLFSKMRFVAAQFEALLGGDLWLENALHANAMARRLAEGLSGVSGVEVAHPVQANGVFAVLPGERLDALREAFTFYMWDDKVCLARLMASFDTTEEDVDAFVRLAAG